jgi:hypothetical protein
MTNPVLTTAARRATETAETTWPAKTAAKVAGLTRDTLQDWIDRGLVLVEPDPKSNLRRKTRLSVRSTFCAFVAGILLARGRPLQELHDTLTVLGGADDLLDLVGGAWQCWLVIETGWMAGSAPGKPRLSRREDAAFLSINLRQLWRTFQQRREELEV